MRLRTRNLIILALVLALASCGSLPRGAAVQKDILQSANAEVPEIAVYPVTRSFLAQIQTWPKTVPDQYPWIGHSHGSGAQVIRPGDTLNMTIWDSGENSLLTGNEQRTAAFSGLRVSETGMIFVPYVGQLKVSDSTPETARALIQRRLEESVPSVQVQLLMAEGRQNSVDLVSGVRSPGAITLPDQNFSVLSALSAGGGVLPTLQNPQITLMRGHDIYATSVERLFAHPKLDTRLLGGDKLIVAEDRRYFLSLGAAGKEAQHPFNRDSLSALDALAIIGGVNESRADPQGILILREYPSSSVGETGPSQTRVVFTLDLTESDGLFSARNFAIHPGDLVLATESPLTNAQTILSMFGSAFGIIRATSG